MADLSDVTTDELYEELEGRFDCCVFAAQGLQKRSDKTFVYLRWNPRIIEAWGLLRMADHILHRRYGDDYSDPEPDDVPMAGD